jgi:voltage-gated potassium channel
MEPEYLTTPRLQAYLVRTQTPLDILALLTIWLSVLPFTSVHPVGQNRMTWVIARLALSSVYGIDMVIRSRLSARPVRYPGAHPLACAAVLIPAVRITFSVRLLRAMFRKGALAHFLSVALVLILNGVIMVFAFEDNAPGSNIHTIGQSFWWACVTVATVGYGDFYPVTLGGRLTAVGLMALGLVTAAVVTAQIASSFMDQATARRASIIAEQARAAALEVVEEAEAEAASVDSGMSGVIGGDVAVLARLDRIEQLLVARFTADGPPQETSE